MNNKVDITINEFDSCISDGCNNNNTNKNNKKRKSCNNELVNGTTIYDFDEANCDSDCDCDYEIHELRYDSGYKGALPWWHSKKRHKEVEAMLSGDHKDEYLREVRGIQTENDVYPVFNHIFVDLILHETSIYKGNHYPKNIFSVIDPACGGNSSKQAVSTFMYVGDLMVVSIIN